MSGVRGRHRRGVAPPPVSSPSFLAALAAQRESLAVATAGAAPPAPRPPLQLRGFVFDATRGRHFPRGQVPLPPLPQHPLPQAPPLLSRSAGGIVRALLSREGGALRSAAFAARLCRERVSKWAPLVASTLPEPPSCSALAVLPAVLPNAPHRVAVGGASGGVYIARVSDDHVGDVLLAAPAAAGPVSGLALESSALAVAHLGAADVPGSLSVHAASSPCGSVFATPLCHTFARGACAWGVVWASGDELLVPLSDARVERLALSSGTLRCSATWRGAASGVKSDVLCASSAPEGCSGGSAAALLGMRTGGVMFWDSRLASAAAVASAPAAPCGLFPLPALSPYALALCDARRSAAVWDSRRTAGALFELRGYVNSARRTGVAVGASFIAAACADQRVRVWDVAAGGAELYVSPADAAAPPLSVAFCESEAVAEASVQPRTRKFLQPWPQLVSAGGSHLTLHQSL